jgi:hypothetical protein
MPTTIMLDLDITGLDISNRIIDEPHSLSGRPTRSIAPRHGAFFGDSLQIHDGTTLLSRGVDYQIVELHQEATLRFGKEIASVILIINPQVSSNPTVTYQALGGHFALNNNAIANLYESVITDSRPVDWTNVFNKPTEFTPTIHRHLLDDVYGFEPVVDYLERIKRAITLGQSDVILSTVKALLARSYGEGLYRVLPSTRLIQFDALLYFLSRRKILADIWIDSQQTKWLKGSTNIFEIDTSGYPLATTLYWEFYKPDSVVALFSQKSGYIITDGTVMSVTVYTPSPDFVTDSPIYLGVKEGPEDVEYKAVTYQLQIQEHVSTTEFQGYLYNCHSLPNEQETFIGDIARSNEHRLYYLLSYS